MRTNVRIKFLLLHLSTTTIILHNQFLCVKSALTLDIDHVLPPYLYKIGNKIVKQNSNNDGGFKNAINYPSKNTIVKRDVAYKTQNVNDFLQFTPSKKDPFLQEKSIDIHSLQGKSFLTNEIIPADLMTDGTFKLFGHNPFASFSHVLKQNEHISTNTKDHPLRPGTVDDLKSFDPLKEHGQHMAMDVHTYPTKSSPSFKAPDITYEGFVPCSPPQCKRANSPSHIPLTSKPKTSTYPPPPPPPPELHTTTTKSPNSYQTSTSGLPFYNPPSPKPSYNKPSTNTPSYNPPSPKPSYNAPKENTPNGFLVEYHPFKDVSNAIEEPNLFKAQPSKGKHHHNEGYNNAFHQDEFGHQLVDLIKDDYKYVHHEEGVNSIHPEDHHLPNSTWIFHDDSHPHLDSAHPHSAIETSQANDIATNSILDNNNNPHKENVGHQLIDLHIKDHKYIHDDTKKDEKKVEINAPLDTHEIKPHQEHVYHGIDGTFSPPKETINLIKDDYHYVPPTGISISTTHRTPKAQTVKYDETHAGTYPGHQLVDLIKDDYNYIHNETGISVSNSHGISTTAIYPPSPFGSIHDNFIPSDKGHQLVDLIKDDYQYVQTTAASTIQSHSNLPTFEKVENEKTIAQNEIHGSSVDHQVIDLIKDDYKYVQDIDSPSKENGITQGERLTLNPSQTPRAPKENDSEPEFSDYGEDNGSNFLGDNFIDLGNSNPASNSKPVVTINNRNPTTNSNSQQSLGKPLAAVTAVLQHTQKRKPKSRPSVLVIHHDAPVHAVPLGTNGFIKNGEFQQTQGQQSHPFRQEEHSNLGNHAFNILSGNTPSTFIQEENFVLRNNIPTNTPPSLDATSNTVTLQDHKDSTTIMKPNEIAALFSANKAANDIAAVNEIHHQDNLFDQMHNNIPFKTNHPFPPRLLSEFMQTQTVMKDVMMSEAVNSKPKPRRPKQIMPNFLVQKLPSMHHLRQLQQEFGKGIAHFPLWREDFRSMPSLRPSKIPDPQNSNFVHQSPIGRPLKFRRGMRPKFKKGLKKIKKFKVHSITGQLIPVDPSIPQAPGTHFFTDSGKPLDPAQQTQQLRQGKQINASRPPSQVSHPSQFASPSEQVVAFPTHQPFHGIQPSNRHPHKPRPPSSFAFISMLHGNKRKDRNKRRNHTRRV